MDAGEAGIGRFLEGMLPDADGFLSPAPELTGNAFIAGHVGLAFPVPEGAIGFGAGGALGAVVPETTLDEDEQAAQRRRPASRSIRRNSPGLWMSKS